MIQFITSLAAPANRTRQYMAPFVTTTTDAITAQSTMLNLQPSVQSALITLLASVYYVPLLLCGPAGNETVYAYDSGGVLMMTRSDEALAYPAGTTVMAPLAGASGETGAAGAQGAAGPSGDSGASGAQGAQGAAGAVGNAGADGANGSLWYFGAGVPSSGTGTTIDYYLNITTGDVFSKTSGSWIVIGSLKGPGGSDGTNGATWNNGAGAPSPSLGIDGDYYINTDNGDLYKKAAGSWGVIANIKGPQGVFGNNGTPGSRWFFGTGTPSNSFGTTIDYYLEIDSADWYQKSSGSWVVGGSLKGTPGTPGSNGAPGYSQSLHIWMTRTTPVSAARQQDVDPQTNTIRYNDITGCTAATPGTIDVAQGAYMITGHGEVSVSFASTYSGVVPSGTIVAEIWDGTTWNQAETYSTYGMKLMFGTDNWFTSVHGLHGVVDIPTTTGKIRLRAHGDWDAGIASANVSMTMKLTVLRIQ